MVTIDKLVGLVELVELVELVGLVELVELVELVDLVEFMIAQCNFLLNYFFVGKHWYFFFLVSKAVFILSTAYLIFTS